MKKSIYLSTLALFAGFALFAKESNEEETVHLRITQVINGETIEIDTVIKASEVDAFKKEVLSEDAENVNINVRVEDGESSHHESRQLMFVHGDEMDGEDVQVEVTIDEDGNEIIMVNGEIIDLEDLGENVFVYEVQHEGHNAFMFEGDENVEVTIDENDNKTILLNGEEITEEELAEMHEMIWIEKEGEGSEQVIMMEIRGDSDMEVAIEADDEGNTHFFVNGEELTEEEFHSQMAKMHEGMETMLVKECPHGPKADCEKKCEKVIIMDRDGGEQGIRVTIDEDGTEHVWVNGEEVDPDELDHDHFNIWSGEDGDAVIVEEISVGGKDHKVIVVKESSEEGDVEFIREGTEVIEVRHGTQQVVIVRVEGEEIGSVGSGGSTLNAKEFNLYPNPSDGQITVEFELEEKAKTNLQIFDQSGRVVLEEDLGKIEGRWMRQFDLGQYGAGVYYINLSQGKKALTKKFIVE